MSSNFRADSRSIPKINMENVRQRQSKYGYARASAEFQRSPHTVRTPRTPTSSSARRMRFLSKSDKGWSWLSIKMRDVASEVKMGMARKGELPPEIVQALWGRRSLKSCCTGTEAVVDHMDKHMKGQTARDAKARSRSKKVPENLMDVLLQKWVYFDHVHSDVSRVDKHIHAKYCEDSFGHFLLPDGRQIHGSYSVPLSYLMQELRKLLTHLRSKIVNTNYKDLPVFSTPGQEIVPEFDPPQMKPLPQLYPIEGVLPIPTEESEGVGPDLQPPVFVSPVPKEHPPLILPPLLKVPPLKLPPQPIFQDDESSIDRSLYKEEPLPTYYPPEQIPLPEWQNPRLIEFPIEPVTVQPPVYPMPILESVPPFVPPALDPRPCEKSYYTVDEENGAVCLCDGKCLGNLDKYARKGKSCQANPRPLLPIPPPPFPLPLVLKPEPVFVPPVGEALPEFIPPKLREKPVYIPPPPPVLPPWKPPPPPDPIGWIAGQRPIFLIDCSGTMARGGMKMAFDILSTIFAPGGQVDIGATHFDIIMYSFDAWSYGAMENYKMNRQGASGRFFRPLEAMQEKTPATLQAALNWALRWRAAGTTNLLKALDVAFNRTSADCIYLMTDGKPDKPVLVLQQIRQILRLQGSITPIHTIGLGTNKSGERFLTRISEATGGGLRHLDHNWSKKPETLTGTELEDMLWIKSMIEAEQRKNLAFHRQESVQDIQERVRLRYEKERHVPRIVAHQKQGKQMQMDYQTLVQSIEAENLATLARAQELYDRECVGVKQRNQAHYEYALELWKGEVRRVNDDNQRAVETVERWKESIKQIEEQNHKLVQESIEQFAKDVEWVEEMNRKRLQQAQEYYDAEVANARAVYESAVRETERKQKEIEETVATRNKVNRDNYERALAEVLATNAEITGKAHADHTARVAYVESENERMKKEAEQSFSAEYERVKLDNAVKVAMLQDKIQEIKSKKEAAVETHKAQVAAAIAEYDVQAKKFAALNQENEEQVRKRWKETCDAIDDENIENAKKAVEEYEADARVVTEGNMKKAKQRIEILKRKLEIEKYNEELTKKKKVKWKEECEKEDRDYEEEVSRAKMEHEKVCEEVNMRNAEKFQAALLEHKAKVAAVDTYNETIRPFVEASSLIKAEIARVEKFIKYLANACLDPNRKKGSDDLNVLAKSQQGLETKILIEALQEAYASRKEDGDFVHRPSFYSVRDFSGIIPIHPPRVTAHMCPDHLQHKQQHEQQQQQQQEEEKEEEKERAKKVPQSR